MRAISRDPSISSSPGGSHSQGPSVPNRRRHVRAAKRRHRDSCRVRRRGRDRPASYRGLRPRQRCLGRAEDGGRPSSLDRARTALAADRGTSAAGASAVSHSRRARARRRADCGGGRSRRLPRCEPETRRTPPAGFACWPPESAASLSPVTDRHTLSASSRCRNSSGRRCSRPCRVYRWAEHALCSTASAAWRASWRPGTTNGSRSQGSAPSTARRFAGRSPNHSRRSREWQARSRIRRRDGPPGRNLRRRLGPGGPAAPERGSLALLPPGPDAVRILPVRGTWPSAPRAPAQAPKSAAPRTAFGPARAGCGFREPLAPRLARPGRAIVAPAGRAD